MLVWTLLSIFGIWIVDRTLREVEKLKIISAKHELRFRNTAFIVVICLNFVSRKNNIALLVVNSVIILSPVLLPMFIEAFRHQKIKDQLITLTDQLILTMRSGKSFRVALQKLIDDSDIFVKIVLQELFISLQYQREITNISADRQIQIYLYELSQVDRSSHKSIDMLQALRRKLLLTKTFRQRSRQALLQTRAQSIICAGMYFLITVYVHFEFGLAKNPAITFASVFLFVVGLAVTFRMGRHYQWKI